MVKNDFLEKEPVARLLFKLALPAIAAQLINMLYNLVDRIYIGHIPEVGSNALTGVGVCMPLILVISAFAALVSMGGAPRASIYMGEKNNEKAEKVLGNSVTLLVIISLVLTVVIIIFLEDLLTLFGASENTIGFASSYMKIYALGTIFVQLALGLNAYITTQGFAKMSMLTVLIGAVVNIVLDPIFIFAFNMGVKGAALATIISQAISAFWVIMFLNSKKTILKIRLVNLKLDFKLIAPCILLGLAPFIMQITESIIMICFNSSLQKYGGDIAVGAMTILMSVMQLSMLPLQGLGQGAQPIASYNYGAKNSSRVKETFFKLLLSCLIYSFTIWIAIMIYPRGFASIFTDDVLLIDYTSKALRIYMAVSCIFGIQIACQMILVALGNAASSVIVAIVRKIVLLIPLIYLLPFIFGYETKYIYLAEPVADVLAVTFTAILFATQFKKTLKKMSLESPN